MSVYLGEAGGVELKRDSLNVPVTAAINPDDVNVEKRRFSFDFAAGALISGDQLEIASQSGSTLTFIAGAQDNSWEGFAHVDPAGGIRLYLNFSDAIEGSTNKALQLVQNSVTENISIETKNSAFRCLAQVESFELTDSRDTVDITSLGEEFRKNYANGLISGQGTLNCFWDYRNTPCDEVLGTRIEFPHYLAQLVLRLRQGADFIGRFYIYTDGKNAVWQEATCIVTNVAITVAPTTLIQTSIQFVTTGEIRLLTGTPPSVLLQENEFRILTENDEGLGIEDDD